MTITGGSGTAPRLLKYSIVVWSIAIACWLTAGILNQVFRNTGALHLSTTNTSVSVDDTGALVTHTQDVSTIAPAYIAGIVFGLPASLWIALVVMMARGANWARITQTVLAVLGAIAILLQIQWIFRGQPGDGTTIPASLDIAALAALPVAVAALYLPRTNAYFAGRPFGTAAPPRPRLPRPVEVARAVRLWWIAFAIDAVGGIVSLFMPNPTMPLWLHIANVSVALAIQITLIMFLSRGANWARILLTIAVAYAALAVIQTVAIHPSEVPQVVLSLVTLAVKGVAIVLLYQPAANTYFKAVRAEAVKLRYSDRPAMPRNDA